VKFDVSKIAPDAARPHGINYSLCLFSPSDERLVCFDNAHPLRTRRASVRSNSTNDHMHMGQRMTVYALSGAEKFNVGLLERGRRSA